MAEVEVGRCGEYADLSPAVLRGDEGLEGPPVFGVCVQGLRKEEGDRASARGQGSRSYPSPPGTTPPNRRHLPHSLPLSLGG